MDYNAHKAGVDNHDQMTACYPISRKTVKWWKKIFFYFFQMGIVNAQKYYNLSNQHKMSLQDFMEQIGVSLGELDGADEPPVPLAAAEPRRTQKGFHLPIRIPPTACKANPTRRCHHCSGKPGPDGKKP